MRMQRDAKYVNKIRQCTIVCMQRIEMDAIIRLMFPPPVYPLPAFFGTRVHYNVHVGSEVYRMAGNGVISVGAMHMIIESLMHHHVRSN